MKCDKFEKEYLEKLRIYASEGKYRNEIASLLNIELYTIYYYAKKFNIMIYEYPWNKDKIDRLKILASQGNDYSKIAKELNTTKPIVINACKKNGIITKILWTEDRTNQLIKIYKNCKNIEGISRLMNLSKEEIYQHLINLKLYQTKRWCEEDIIKLKDFFLNEHKTIKEVEAYFGVGYGAIRKVCDAHNIDTTKHIHAKYAKDKEILECLIKGIKNKDIILKLNTSKTTIKRVVAANNFKTQITKQKEKTAIEKEKFIKKVKKLNIEQKFLDIIFNKFYYTRNYCNKYNLKINITPEYLANIFKNQKGLCFYSKNEMSCEKNDLYSLSIDRINSDKSYLIDNIVLCCSCVNYMKSDLSKDKFIELCKTIANNN